VFGYIMENVKIKTPLVHCISNYVTVNDCANIIMACGGAPIMADDQNEVEEISSICDALYINIGTLNERTIASMLKAGKKAAQLNHPVVLDPVGAGASSLRTTTTFNLLEQVDISVIRGNASEIKTLSSGIGTTKGVDADVSDSITEERLGDAIRLAQQLSRKNAAVIAITGAIDIVADSDKAYIIRNGHPLMSKITGTGCMLTAVIAAFCAANKEQLTEAAAAAVCVMGLCGELAHARVLKNDAGISSYSTYIIDEMSKMNGQTLQEGMKIEVK